MELWDNILIFKIGLLEMPPQLLDLFFLFTSICITFLDSNNTYWKPFTNLSQKINVKLQN